MFTPDTRYHSEFTISSFDTDTRGRASLPSICRYLQEMAVQHAEQLKLGFDDMIKENRAWVLAQMLIQLETYPSMHEKIGITTWSNGPDGRFAMRDFELFDEAGNQIGGASSTWFVVDISSKSICRLDNYFSGYRYENIEFALGRRPERVKPFTDGNNEQRFGVYYSDLDINSHVNNVRYIDRILDPFPAEFREANSIREIEMNFLKEVKLGDSILVQSKKTEKKGEYQHCLINESNGKPSFTARTQWVEG